MLISFFTEKAFAKFQAFNYQALNLLKHTPTHLCNQTAFSYLDKLKIMAYFSLCFAAKNREMYIALRMGLEVNEQRVCISYSIREIVIECCITHQQS